MRRITLLLLPLLAFTAVAQSKTRTYQMKVSDFNHLEVDNNIRVDYICSPDSAGVILFFADDSNASNLYFSDNGKGKLDIQCCADCTYDSSFPSVKVYSSSLKKIVNAGDSLVTASNVPDCERFDATLCGNGILAIHGLPAKKVNAKISTGCGQLIIDGRCTEANLSIVGTGTIQADNLNCVTCKAKILGTGTIGCNPSEKLSVSGMGTGNVFYRQAPPELRSHAIGIKHSQLLPGTE